jgi:drug/metabolite transporter (DMT)-like permease
MSLIWFPLTLVCALSLATSDALTKKALAGHDEVLILWLRFAVALPFLMSTLLVIPVPTLAPGFWPAVITALPLEMLAAFLYVRALKVSPLGLTLPFLAFTPVFLLVIPWLLLGERIAPAGGAGILCIAAGSYTLNLKELQQGFLAPFHAIRREPGSRMMIVVAFIYSFTSTLGKKAISCSSPLFFAALYFLLLVSAFAPIALWRGGRELARYKRRETLRAAFLPGISYAVSIASHMLAISLTNVAYMISVKRLSLLFGVIYGHLLFKEPEIRERLLGTVLMLAGVALIVWSSM